MKEKPEKDLTAIHNEAVKRFAVIQEAEQDQREYAIEDMLFANSEGGQWDEVAIQKRGDRPRYTINKIGPAIDQIVGDQRQNRTQIKVRPVDTMGDEKSARLRAGLIRNIESQSKAENAYDFAFSEAVTGGYGGWRIVTQYADDDVFDQDIRLKPIPSAASSLWFDPAAMEYDKRDAAYAFVTSFVPQEKFEDEWPNATAVDFSQERYNQGGYQYWKQESGVMVAEYWVKTPITKELALLSDGRVIDPEEEKDVLDELALAGITIEKTRKVKTHKVEMYKMSGMEILEGPKEFASKYIPLVPLFGKISCIEGKTYVRGIVRLAKDAQRIYNYAVSANIEAAALTPKDPYWMTPKMMLGLEDRYKSYNQKSTPFMLYNPDPKHPGGVPTRTGAPSMQNALVQTAATAGLDIHATTGLEPASLGNVPELKSGKAIQAQQAMGDRGAYVFSDNLSKSIEYTGEILMDMIPRIYDTHRVIRVLGIDGKTETAEINKEAFDSVGMPILDRQTGKQVIVNDMSAGKYDIVVETGPAYSTLRQESAAQLIELSAGNPIFQELGTDLIAKNLNMVEGDELTKRVRRYMIMRGVVQPNEEEVQEMGLDQQQPDPKQVALVQNIEAQTRETLARAGEKEASTAKTKMEIQNTAIKNLDILLEAYTKQIEAGIAVTPKQRDLLVSTLDIIEDAQAITTGGGPNSEQLQDIISRLQTFGINPANPQQPAIGNAQAAQGFQ